MKQYNNGQRPQKMYGGGMAMRKPMMQQPKMGMTGMAGTGQMSGMNKGGKLNAGLRALKKERPDVVKKMGFKKVSEAYSNSKYGVRYYEKCM